MQNNPIAAALSTVTLGGPVAIDNLAMFPLLASTPGAPAPSYALLDEALGPGLADITEISEHGSVPELKVINRADRPLLIVDGEELLGAKQNRVVNLTIMVAAHAELAIPVSCVEAGRWRARSAKFAAAPRAQYASGRAKRMMQVTHSLRDRGERMSDQAEVWADIAEKSERLGARSATSAMSAIFTDLDTSIERFVAACTPVDGQAGALFAVNGAIVGFDLFDHPSTLARLLPKLVRSVAVDALDAAKTPSRSQAPLHVLAEQFMAVTAAAPHHASKAVGLGDDLRLSAPQIAGAALVVDEHVVHVGAFAL